MRTNENENIKRKQILVAKIMQYDLDNSYSMIYDLVLL